MILNHGLLLNNLKNSHRMWDNYKCGVYHTTLCVLVVKQRRVHGSMILSDPVSSIQSTVRTQWYTTRVSLVMLENWWKLIWLDLVNNQNYNIHDRIGWPKKDRKTIYKFNWSKDIKLHQNYDDIREIKSCDKNFNWIPVKMLKLCRSRQWPDFVSWNSKRYFSCKFYDISLDDDDDVGVKCDTWLDRTWDEGLQLEIYII